MSDKSEKKSTGKRLLNAIGRAGVEMWNESRESRIAEVDEQIEELQKKRTQLVDELIDLDKPES